jgi:hypothetical protein
MGLGLLFANKISWILCKCFGDFWMSEIVLSFYFGFSFEEGYGELCIMQHSCGTVLIFMGWFQYLRICYLMSLWPKPPLIMCDATFFVTTIKSENKLMNSATFVCFLKRTKLHPKKNRGNGKHREFGYQYLCCWICVDYFSGWYNQWFLLY